MYRCQYSKSLLGIVIEWYDFGLYAFYVLAISKVFFPNVEGVSSNSLLWAFLIFGIGYAARPIGGYLFGRLGDIYGSYLVVITAVNSMTFLSFVFMLLPSYEMVGYWSIYLLILVRFLQGIALGGQGIAFIPQRASQEGNVSFRVGVIFSAITFGLFLAISVTFFLKASLPSDYQIYAWRIAIGFGVLLGLVFAALTRKDRKTIEKVNKSKKIKYQKRAKNISLYNLFRDQFKGLSGIFLLAFVSGSLYFFIYSYMNTLMLNHTGFSAYSSYTISLCMSAIGCVLYPIGGLAADKLGKQKVSITGMIIFVPIVGLILLGNFGFHIFLLLALGLVCSHVMIVGGLSLSSEAFYEKWRTTAYSISYNSAKALVGFFPALVQISISYGNQAMLFALMTLIIIIGLLGHLIIRNSKRKGIELKF